MNTNNARSGTWDIGLKFIILLVIGILVATNTGCLIPMYSGDPIRRAQELIYTSEDLRAITDEWERIWFLDQPSHMPPFIWIFFPD